MGKSKTKIEAFAIMAGDLICGYKRKFEIYATRAQAHEAEQSIEGSYSVSPVIITLPKKKSKPFKSVDEMVNKMTGKKFKKIWKKQKSLRTNRL